jgi:hypothetical protein
MCLPHFENHNGGAWGERTIMTYDLAKKLKDAGFPVKLNFGFINVSLVMPTLSELIEACGEKIHSIQFRPNIPGTKCYVLSELSKDNGPVFSAESPEVSVANLWLALHGKLS